MIDTASLHDEAMALAEAGDRARRSGDHGSAKRHFEHALDLERRAASGETTQPSRSILFRSAAWLALEAEDALEAERLAACGLSDVQVPDRVRTELRSVAEEARVRLARTLPPPSAMSSLAIHLEGPAIGYGVADPADIMPRTTALLNLVFRTAERRSNAPFRRRGQPAPHIRKQVEPRLEHAAASVVVRLQLGGDQPELWDRNHQLVEHIRECFKALASEDPATLRGLIPDESYRANFEALAARLGPDGERVSTVDLLGASTGHSLAPVRLRRRTPTSKPPASNERETQSFIGEIRAADETSSLDTIKLVTGEGTTLTFEVNEAVMEDIVRPFYGQRVTLEGRKARRPNRWVLTGGPELADDTAAGGERRTSGGSGDTA